MHMQSPRRSSRSAATARRRLAGIALLLAVLLVGLPPARPASAEWAPPDATYFPSTGHVVAEPFLSFWRENGRDALVGEPISEQLVTGEVTMQYFTRARLELRGGIVARGRLGAEYLAGRGIVPGLAPQRTRLLRGDGFDEPPLETPYTRHESPGFAPDDPAHRFFPETGHTLNSSFKALWDDGGLPRFGHPLSEEFAEPGPVDGRTRTTQYFERARFEYRPDAGPGQDVVVTPLGATVAAAHAVPPGAVAQGGNPVYDDALFVKPAPPPVVAADPAPAAAGRPAAAPRAAKLIDVDLSAQYLTAYDGNTVAYAGSISSGAGENATPIGTYTIYSKLATDDMRGDDPSQPGGTYFQPDVPWVMYFAAGGYAIHGVYWHNSFGTPRSHGCVGAPVGSAAFLYNWAPIGTQIHIHY